MIRERKLKRRMIIKSKVNFLICNLILPSHLEYLTLKKKYFDKISSLCFRNYTVENFSYQKINNTKSFLLRKIAKF